MKKIVLLVLLATMVVSCCGIHTCNCKSCEEQNKQFIREQVDSILTEIFD